MKIIWLGHSSFLIETGHCRIITDPFDDTTGYPIPDISADLVTVSHDHHDHNMVDNVSGNPRIINSLEKVRFGDVEIFGVSTYHDHSQGRERGDNTVYVIKAEGFTVCHLGDLGHLPDSAQLEAIGQVDVLLIPVGGTYTIAAKEAVEVIRLIKPRISIPMHYKAPVCPYPITPLQDFAQHFDEVVKLPYLELSSMDSILLPEIVVLDYSCN
ncbi:MAG: MBL fold metallo-hydrolase [Syntrophomonadaceae bacterium]|nr:MBL fold metallo-hydrolase [Syntrophomonadaceae bacterium]